MPSEQDIENKGTFSRQVIDDYYQETSTAPESNSADTSELDKKAEAEYSDLIIKLCKDFVPRLHTGEFTLVRRAIIHAHGEEFFNAIKKFLIAKFIISGGDYIREADITKSLQSYELTANDIYSAITNAPEVIIQSPHDFNQFHSALSRLDSELFKSYRRGFILLHPKVFPHLMSFIDKYIDKSSHNVEEQLEPILFRRELEETLKVLPQLQQVFRHTITKRADYPISFYSRSGINSFDEIKDEDEPRQERIIDRIIEYVQLNLRTESEENIQELPTKLQELKNLCNSDLYEGLVTEERSQQKLIDFLSSLFYSPIYRFPFNLFVVSEIRLNNETTWLPFELFRLFHLDSGESESKIIESFQKTLFNMSSNIEFEALDRVAKVAEHLEHYLGISKADSLSFESYKKLLLSLIDKKDYRLVTPLTKLFNISEQQISLINTELQNNENFKQLFLPETIKLNINNMNDDRSIGAMFMAGKFGSEEERQKIEVTISNRILSYLNFSLTTDEYFSGNQMETLCSNLEIDIDDLLLQPSFRDALDSFFRQCSEHKAGYLYLRNFSHLASLSEHLSEENSQLILNNTTDLPQGMTIGEVIKYLSDEQGNKLISNLGNSKYYQLNFQKDILPVIQSQGVGAFLFFEEINKRHFGLFTSDQWEFIRKIAQKWNTQARNIIINLVGPMWRGEPDLENDQGDDDSDREYYVRSNNLLSKEQEPDINEYLEDINIVDNDIFRKYLKIKKSENAEKLTEYKNQLFTVKKQIYEGTVPEKEYNDASFSSLLYATFPPAISLAKHQYERLLSSREDRRTDVPVELNSLQYREFTVDTGSYQVESGETLDSRSWKLVQTAVNSVNEKNNEKDNQNNLDNELTVLLQKLYLGERDSQGYQSETIALLYRKYLIDGGEPKGTIVTGEIRSLFTAKEFLTEVLGYQHLNKWLQEWVIKNSALFNSIKEQIISKRKLGASQIGKLLSLVKQYQKNDLNEEAKQKMLAEIDNQLRNTDISVEEVLKMSHIQIKQYFENVRVEITNEDITDQIIVDMLAPTAVAMRNQLNKIKFTQSGEINQKTLSLIISKKKEHSLIGFNMGVCVTPDKQLWNDPTFMNCIVFDKESKTAMGGIHLLIRDGYLCLPGINPSIDLLSTVKADSLFNQLMNYCKETSQTLGLKGVLIPISPEIQSNREQIQKVILSKKYKRIVLATAAKFSYSPYEYSFSECYQVN